MAEDAQAVCFIGGTRIGPPHSLFPDQERWLRIDVNRSELRWADGVHLDERSAVIISRSINEAFQKFLGPT